ncbi:MAG: NAD(P)H-binding protein, partial [Alphaproteobacteria bacterium]|nr:NAD(P)H-binding protein [Alphaproteobacteria bacterium]
RSTLRTDGARNTVAAMEGAGVRRIVAMSGLGAGDSRQALPFPVRFFVAPVILGRLLADQDGLEAALAASGVAWTAVRAGELKDEPARGGWRVALDGRVSTAVARADVARFLVEQLTDDTYVGKTPAIGYP